MLYAKKMRFFFAVLMACVGAYAQGTQFDHGVERGRKAVVDSAE